MDGREILQRLAEPFSPDKVSWRIGSTSKDKSKGMALAYIDARDVMDRLDEVCGADWQCEYPTDTDKRAICRISIKIDGEWRHRECGAGDSATEGAKGGLSDAFKRAAVKWGIGRYLYDIESPWVKLEDRGRIPDSEKPRLRKVLERVTLQTERNGHARANGHNGNGSTRIAVESSNGNGHANGNGASEPRKPLPVELVAYLEDAQTKALREKYGERIEVTDEVAAKLKQRVASIKGITVADLDLQLMADFAVNRRVFAALDDVKAWLRAEYGNPDDLGQGQVADATKQLRQHIKDTLATQKETQHA